MKRSPGRLLLILTAAVVVASIALALTMIDSPAVQRKLRMDERRITDLRQLQVLIDNHYQERKRLPANLSELAQAGVGAPGNDPETGTAYGYRVLDERRYQLCANFATDTAATSDGRRNWVDPQWAHPAGQHCLSREAARLE